MKYRELNFNGQTIQYCIFDPTGNITALSDTPVDPADQPAAAAKIMEANKDVEQVGFVTFAGAEGDAGKAAAAGGAPAAEGRAPSRQPAVSLRMAGGEFCGNAAMSAAAFYMIRAGLKGEATVMERVSGAAEPVEIRLKRTGENSFDSAITMPPDAAAEFLTLQMKWEGFEGAVGMPVVFLEGITHLIATPRSEVFGLRDKKETAEGVLRAWQPFLTKDCVGMMFLDDGDGRVTAGGSEVRRLTPLVYVPGADTMFWENSCASGSAAAAIFLSSEARGPVDVTFEEPAGKLRVESDITKDKTVLHGSVKLIER